MHTPGPWKVGEPANRDPKILSVRSEVIKGSIFVVAQVTKWDCAIPEDEWKANAKLIAAAPDLLAVCKEVLALLEANGYELQSREILRAAIDKAEGR